MIAANQSNEGSGDGENGDGMGLDPLLVIDRNVRLVSDGPMGLVQTEFVNRLRSRGSCPGRPAVTI